MWHRHLVCSLYLDQHVHSWHKQPPHSTVTSVFYPVPPFTKKCNQGATEPWCITQSCWSSTLTMTFVSVQTAVTFYKNPRYLHATHTLQILHPYVCTDLSGIYNWQSDHRCNTLCAVIQCKLFLINELSLHESDRIQYIDRTQTLTQLFTQNIS